MVKNLTAINQISLRYNRPHISQLPKIINPSEAIKKLRDHIEIGILDLKEYHWIFLLTADNRLLGISEINSGTVVATNIFVREIIQLALITNAVGIILVHNHTSGSLTPSNNDIEVTNKIKEIGEIMDVHLRDHLIITSEGYTSMRSNMKW